MQATGFWSYARGDDEHLDKRVTELRRRIEGEVSMLLGRDVGIFQDIHDLRTGDPWEEKLRANLSKASFLVPILTPLFFNRAWCRDEVLTFLRLSKEAGLEPRIFPIRFVDWDEEEGCEVREALSPFQNKDFTHRRFESDPTRRAWLENDFAKDVKAQLKLQRPAALSEKPKEPMLGMAEGRPSFAPLPPKSSIPSNRHDHTVDPWPGKADFTSIQAAIDAAKPGDKIVVREGIYREALRLSKVLKICGEGDVEKILITTDKGHALWVNVTLARISGLRFRHEAGNAGIAVVIDGDAIELEDCVVESRSRACLVVSGGESRLVLRRCNLRDGREQGLWVTTGARVEAEECRFSRNQKVGVSVFGAGSHAELRRCVLEDGGADGFNVISNATGFLDSCQLIGNLGNGASADDGAKLRLRDCAANQNKGCGVGIVGRAEVSIDGGEVLDYGNAGLFVSSAGQADVRRLQVSGNRYEAIWIRDAESSGRFHDNDLSNNILGPWDIAPGAKVERFNNKE